MSFVTMKYTLKVWIEAHLQISEGMKIKTVLLCSAIALILLSDNDRISIQVSP